MSSMAKDTTERFKVVVNRDGRHALWPAQKPIPSGWNEALPDRSRAECLDYVNRSWTDLHVRREQERRPIGFGILFFGGDEGNAAREKYEFVINVARYADVNGFSAIWLPERHFARMGSLYPNPAVLHAALARETKSIRLRAGSVVLPLHEPIRVAEEWALVDNLSNGRVEISFAPGWNTEDFALRPDHYASRYEVMYKGIQTVEKLWAGQTVDVVDGSGQSVQVRTYPTPVQKRLIKWVTAAGSPRSFEQAGEIGADLLTHLFDQGVEELAGKIALYRQARAQHGWDPNAGRVAVTLHTFLAGDPDEVRQKAYRPYCDYLKANVKLLEKLAESRNVPVDLSRLTPAQLDEAVAWLFEKFLRQRSLLGTPETCAELIKKLSDIGVQEVACLVDFGPSPEDILDALPRLTELKNLCQTMSEIPD